MARFDTRNLEALQKRKVKIRELFTLPENGIRNVLHLLTEGSNRSDVFRTCITCTYFESIEMMGAGLSEKCTLVNILPPAAVIADGCEKYSDIFDDIPF